MKSQEVNKKNTRDKVSKIYSKWYNNIKKENKTNWTVMREKLWCGAFLFIIPKTLEK